MPDEQLYRIEPRRWNDRRLEKLRDLADTIEDSDRYQEMDHAAEVAELLRAKADKIETGLRLIERETHSDFDSLVRAVQYVQSGDYGASKIDEEWREYGDGE